MANRTGTIIGGVFIASLLAWTSLAQAQTISYADALRDEVIVGTPESATARLQDLVKKLGVKPEDNPTSQKLKQGGVDNLKYLEGLSGASFDKGYINQRAALERRAADIERLYSKAADASVIVAI